MSLLRVLSLPPLCFSCCKIWIHSRCHVLECCLPCEHDHEMRWRISPLRFYRVRPPKDGALKVSLSIPGRSTRPHSSPFTFSIAIGRIRFAGRAACISPRSIAPLMGWELSPIPNTPILPPLAPRSMPLWQYLQAIVCLQIA